MNTESLQHRFQELFDSSPDGLAAAPGRVNLIGEFTDYNDGYVLPCSLEFRTCVMYRKRDDLKVVVASLNYPGETDTFDLAEPIVRGGSQWGNYIRAVAYALGRRGHSLVGAELLITSDVPQGSGLSSSAALEVAVGGAFSTLSGLNLSPEEIALVGQEAENDFMECQCGIMDQLISAKGQKGHALLIDCQNLATEPVSIPDDLAIVIINSNYPRKLVDSEYNQRRTDCEHAAHKLGVKSLREATMEQLQEARAELTENEFKRAHHVISENGRVLAARESLQGNNMDQLRGLMSESHRSLHEDFEVTVPATDGLVQICQAALGERGAVRMTGGGFGGAIVCLCRDGDVDEIKAAVEAQYFPRYDLNASIYVCHAGGGLEVSAF